MSDMKFTRFVYGLFDPREPEFVRYVGESEDMEKRMRSHEYDAIDGGSVRSLWIAELACLGIRPQYRILDTVMANTKQMVRRKSRADELRWIKNLSKQTPPITNAPVWEKAMIASGVPVEIIKQYRDNLWSHKGHSRLFAPGQVRFAIELANLQAKYPQLFFREYHKSELFLLDCH